MMLEFSVNIKSIVGMTKRLFLNVFLLCVTSHFAGAQVPKKIVVEHFTNTNCSICASKNPGFYANLSSQPNIQHIAVHPSSPYPACMLSQHNVTENDARTNYYGVYGSTPRFIINGELIAPSVNLDNASVF